MSKIEQEILSLYSKITPDKSKQDIIDILQQIGVCLLNSKICFDDEVIKPVFVEAYFKDEENKINYKDHFIHKDKDEQKGDKNSPFHFYLHHTKCPTRKGVDIVIGDKENIKLSYLIKVSKYKEEKCLQSKTGNIIHELFPGEDKPYPLARNLKISLIEDPIDSKINYSPRILPKNKSHEAGYDNEVAIFDSGSLNIKEPPYKVVKSIKPLTIYRKYKK